MQYDMIFSDFDGTLFRTDETVAPETVKAIAAYQAAGGRFVICTGRPLRSILPWARKFGIVGDIVACQGSVIADIATGERSFSSGIENGLALEIVSALRPRFPHVNVYMDDLVWSGVHDEYTEEYERATGNTVRLADPYEIVKERGGRVEKIVAIVSPDENERGFRDYQALFGDRVTVNTSAPTLIEFVANDCTKGESVRRIAAARGIDLKRVIAIGDSRNDLELLAAAGKKIAVANASKELKAIADEIAPSCDNDGVGAVIRKYGLGEQK